jgi:hypothetical protein
MPNGSGNIFVISESRKQIMDDLLDAVNRIADTSFDATNTPLPASTVAKTFGANITAERRSGSTTVGFYRGLPRPGGKQPLAGERSKDGTPLDVKPTKCPKYLGLPSGRTPNEEEKRGAWQLQEEYLAGRLGKNKEENGRLWKTAKWIDKHLRIASMPAEALPPLNIYVGDTISQNTEGAGAPTGQDDEAPDEAGNEGIEFERINVDVGETASERSMCVMDEDGTTRRLDIKTDGYELLRLIDDFEDIDELAKIDINKLALTADPLPERTDFPTVDQRAESIKIVRMLMLGLRTLWHPVKRAIGDHASMTSLGNTQNGVAATVGRTRVIEGLRLAESIRKGLKRQAHGFSMWQSLIDARQEMVPLSGIAASQNMASVDAIIREVLAALPKPVRAPAGHYLNQAAGPVIKLPDAANDNWQAVVSEAA